MTYLNRRLGLSPSVWPAVRPWLTPPANESYELTWTAIYAQQTRPSAKWRRHLVYNDPGATAYHHLNRTRLKSLRKRAKLLGLDLVDRSTGEVLLNPVS
jgi:hypothetical protein